jgi:hypothetical protein
MGKYRSLTTTGWNKGIQYSKRGLGKKEYKFLRNAGLDVKKSLILMIHRF